MMFLTARPLKLSTLPFFPSPILTDRFFLASRSLAVYSTDASSAKMCSLLRARAAFVSSLALAKEECREVNVATRTKPLLRQIKAVRLLLRQASGYRTHGERIGDSNAPPILIRFRRKSSIWKSTATHNRVSRTYPHEAYVRTTTGAFRCQPVSLRRLKSHRQKKIHPPGRVTASFAPRCHLSRTLGALIDGRQAFTIASSALQRSPVGSSMAGK